GVGLDPDLDRDSEPLELCDAPLHEVTVSVLVWQACSQRNLSPQCACSLEQPDVVARNRSDPGRLEPRYTSADDHHAQRAVGEWNARGFEARLRVLYARDRKLPQAAGDTDVEGDALADLRVLSELRLAHEVGIRDLGAGHPDEVATTVLQCPLADLRAGD